PRPRQTPRESLNAPENPPKECRCQMTFSQLEDEILRMHSAARRHDPCRAGPLLEGEHAEEVVASAVRRSALLVDPFLRQFDRVLVGLLKRVPRLGAPGYRLRCDTGS